ncbi:MAG: response regulator, partial [Opitutaceae bacterium]
MSLPGKSPSPPPSAAPRRRRVLLVEDHAVVREALAEMLERSGEWIVCGQTHNGGEACELATSLAAEVILLDFLLNGHDGLELVRALSSLASKPAVLVLSVLAEPEIGERVIRAGARGFLNKRASRTELLHAMREVSAGQIFVSTETFLRIAAHRLKLKRAAEGPSPVDRLSNREFEVMCLLGSRLAISEIGELLKLSPRTIERH